jgi:hypothetical protein
VRRGRRLPDLNRPSDRFPGNNSALSTGDAPLVTHRRGAAFRLCVAVGRVAHHEGRRGPARMALWHCLQRAGGGRDLRRHKRAKAEQAAQITAAPSARQCGHDHRRSRLRRQAESANITGLAKKALASGTVAEKSRGSEFGRREAISRNCFPVWSFQRSGLNVGGIIKCVTSVAICKSAPI